MSTTMDDLGSEQNLSICPWAKQLQQAWGERLAVDYPHLRLAQRESLSQWLLGPKVEALHQLDEKFQRITEQSMEYRYRILSQRYLEQSPGRAYQNLIQRLGSLMVVRHKIRTWVAMSRDRNRAVADVLQEVIQEMLQSDRYIQTVIDWVAQCTEEQTLRNALLLASIEEYCLRPIRNQPLLVYRFVNYLRRSQRGGMTQVPQTERIKMISEEITLDDGDSSLSLFDMEAVSTHQAAEVGAEEQTLRETVLAEFETYLTTEVEPLAVDWLRLYLQGHTQEAIAQILDLPVKQIYRLREKVTYHAVKIFALKGRPDLVANWLQTSLHEHNLGLTASQWQTFWEALTPTQQQIIGKLKMAEPIEAIAKTLELKKSQVMAEWGKIYQLAQGLRSS
ncbi:HetZ-related protein 2 [Spirulina sp. CCNP1310]|uniref:HetZ-related protein 2 n=1 Tax=Spirulina sp. CCNP1310 TaxID=3110249 RepID=UPI002B2026EA|nr:HetZ-related protein 2 [Spirulina sp. CCNP1310]MEA5417773.1 HetZ-related protein 2 [Spirulina sp. CCNP1310]